MTRLTATEELKKQQEVEKKLTMAKILARLKIMATVIRIIIKVSKK